MDLGKFLGDFGGIGLFIAPIILSYLKSAYSASRKRKAKAERKQPHNPRRKRESPHEAVRVQIAKPVAQKPVPKSVPQPAAVELPEEGIRAVADVEPMKEVPRRRADGRRRRLRQALVIGDALRPKFNTF